MKHGLSKKQLDEIVRIIADFTDVEEAVLFGSRAIDTFKEASDVDIAIKGKKVSASLAAKLKYQFEEETYLPFFCDVVAWPTIINEELKKHIRDKGVLIYRKGLSEWKECKLGELGSVITGKTPSKNNPEDWGTDILFVTPSDYKNYRRKAYESERSLSEDGIRRLKNKILPLNSILVTCIGSDMGKVVMNKREAITNQQINSILPKEEIVDNDFLYYRLVEMYEILRVYGGDGTAVPIVNKGDFENIETTIPPLTEQKAIASVLSSLDNKIDLLHRQNKTLEAMAETIFRQWFIEPSPNLSQRGRDKEAKEDWEDGKLGDVLELVYGKGLKEEIRTGKGFPVVGSSGVVGYHSDFLVEGPGIVIGRKGTLGKVIYVFENFFPIDTTYYIKSKVNSIGLFYEYFLLKSLNLEDMNSDSAVPGLNRDIALSTTIKVAPLEKLKEFNQYSSAFLEKLNANNNQIRTLEILRDTLIPKLMNGEVRVNM